MCVWRMRHRWYVIPNCDRIFATVLSSTNDISWRFANKCTGQCHRHRKSSEWQLFIVRDTIRWKSKTRPSPPPPPRKVNESKSQREQKKVPEPKTVWFWQMKNWMEIILFERSKRKKGKHRSPKTPPQFSSTARAIQRRCKRRVRTREKRIYGTVLFIRIIIIIVVCSGNLPLTPLFFGQCVCYLCTLSVSGLRSSVAPLWMVSTNREQYREAQQ